MPDVELVVSPVHCGLTTAEASTRNWPDGYGYANGWNEAVVRGHSIKERGHVTLALYNAAGQLVRTLVDEAQAPCATAFSVVWNGKNDAGAPVASGVYLYRRVSSRVTR